MILRTIQSAARHRNLRPHGAGSHDRHQQGLRHASPAGNPLDVLVQKPVQDLVPADGLVVAREGRQWRSVPPTSPRFFRVRMALVVHRAEARHVRDR